MSRGAVKGHGYLETKAPMVLQESTWMMDLETRNYLVCEEVMG